MKTTIKNIVNAVATKARNAIGSNALREELATVQRQLKEMDRAMLDLIVRADDAERALDSSERWLQRIAQLETEVLRIDDNEEFCKRNAGALQELDCKMEQSVTTEVYDQLRDQEYVQDSDMTDAVTEIADDHYVRTEDLKYELEQISDIPSTQELSELREDVQDLKELPKQVRDLMQFVDAQTLERVRLPKLVKECVAGAFGVATNSLISWHDEDGNERSEEDIAQTMNLMSDVGQTADEKPEPVAKG